MIIKITDIGSFIGVKQPFRGQEIELFGIKFWIEGCTGTQNGEVIDDLELTLIPKDSLAIKRDLRDTLLGNKEVK